MPKTANSLARIHINKVCRSCLTERGHLREIFSTRIPKMMEFCASIQVTEDDELPPHICVSCFHQISKFYTFKKKMERSDRILRNYIKLNKSNKKSKSFSDILDEAVNDAKIEERSADEISEDDLPLNKRKVMLEKQEKSERFRQSKENAKQFIDSISKIEVVENFLEDIGSNSESSLEKDMLTSVGCNDTNLSTAIFTDGPPPLVPLYASKSELVFEEPPDIPMPNLIPIRNLPENTPPLVPIKPLTAIDPETIVHALGDNLKMETELKLKCSMCEEEFSSVLTLKQHRQSNCQVGQLQCNICKKEFKERKRLIGHLKGHMVVKDHKCKICGKCYPNASSFQVHMRTHTGERPFKCEICNKGFIRWAGVVGHMKTHQSSKPYKCSVCNKGFKMMSNLERHKILHSGNLPYCCSYCSKTFSQSDNLLLHVRTYHTHERPYLCSECGKGFVSSTRLNRHMWIHTGFKPYRCKKCPKAYSNSNDLKHHELKHSEVNAKVHKPHACPSCEKRFFHPCRLARHMKTHERPFGCTECTKTFSTEAVLSRHITSKHGLHIYDETLGKEVFVQYQ